MAKNTVCCSVVLSIALSSSVSWEHKIMHCKDAVMAYTIMKMKVKLFNEKVPLNDVL